MRYLSIASLAAICGIALLGCNSMRVGDTKYVAVLETKVEQLPARTVEVTEDVLKDLNLEMVSSRTTRIDGQFLVRSALRREYRIIVEGHGPRETELTIYGTDYFEDRNQAKLIWAEIASRLATSTVE